MITPHHLHLPLPLEIIHVHSDSPSPPLNLRFAVPPPGSGSVGVTLDWDPPLNSGGVAITGYQVLVNGLVVTMATNTTAHITLDAMGEHRLTVLAVNICNDVSDSTSTITFTGKCLNVYVIQF